ncbi:MAG: hypothetical protein CMM02_05620 [Rhodopirellula sp.]|nr:hypothetical protein [Rhodopirellula sp.]
MVEIKYIFIFIFTLIIGLPLYVMLNYYNVIDKPNSRSSHKKIIVRGGGISVILAYILSVILFSYNMNTNFYILLILLVSFTSFYDDLFNLNSIIRIIVHFVSALATVIILTNLYSNNIIYSQINSYLLIALATIFIVGYTNAFNFMDGMNGMAALQAIISTFGTIVILSSDSVSLDLVPLTYNIFLGCCMLGFLPYNFPKPRMFLGDVGSITLGFIISVNLFWILLHFGQKYFIPLILLHINYILETSITLARRFFNKEKWYLAHNEHFYQKLYRAGKTHVQVSLTYAILQLIVVVLVSNFLSYTSSYKLIISFSIISIWLVFFFYSEWCFKNSKNKGA